MEKELKETVREVVATPEEVLVKTELAAKRLEEANKKFEQNRLLSEEARINKMLDGQAEAGQEPIKPSTQEKIKAEIQSWMPKELLPFNLR